MAGSLTLFAEAANLSANSRRSGSADLEQGDERVGEMRGRYEFEIVGRRVIFRVFAVRRAAETAHREIKFGRAILLPFVVPVRREITDLVWCAFGSQHMLDRSIDVGRVAPGPARCSS